eukprot:3376337-Pyramimonas_sp.AAC.1
MGSQIASQFSAFILHQLPASVSTVLYRKEMSDSLNHVEMTELNAMSLGLVSAQKVTISPV